MSSEFVRNIHHTKLRGKTTEPLDTNIQNDILSDENNAYIRNEDPNYPSEHYVLLTGSLETDQLKSGESDILAVQKDNKHGVTLKPKHAKITSKTNTIKVSENKPLEFELDDTQVKLNQDSIKALNKQMVFAGNDWFSYYGDEKDEITVDNISKDSSLKGEPCKIIFYYADNKHDDLSLKIGEPTKITLSKEENSYIEIKMIEYMGNKKILSINPLEPIEPI